MTYSPDITVTTTDPIALAFTFIGLADTCGEDATAASIAGDHSRAGRDRSVQRAHMKRAEVLTALAQAQALESIADSLSRIALGR